MAKYGNFAPAEPNTPLNVQMFERHLFEMIPTAWKKLGKLTMPMPMPMPKPTPTRRRSVPIHEIATPEFPPPISGSGRIISRRASTFKDERPSKPMGNVINYRQSVRLNELEAQNKPLAKESPRAPIPKFTIRFKGTMPHWYFLHSLFVMY